MRIETIISPLLFNQVENLSEKNVVIIDILRATSTITTILNNGAKGLIAVKSEEEARDYQAKGYLVGGERGGETIPGFDFGNSPFHYEASRVENKLVVLTTTNGTKCIEMAQEARNVLIGSFLNLNAVVQFLKADHKDTVLFCAGWKDHVNIEDSLFAGAIVDELTDQECDDASILLKQAWSKDKNNLFGILSKSNHFKRLSKKGVLKDIEYCCLLNTIASVGVMSSEGVFEIAN